MPGLFQIICVSFCIITVISNILSAKMVLLPIFPLAIPAGLITYPLGLMLCGLVTELFGASQARQMVFLALAMNLLSLLLIQIALCLPASGQADEQAFQSVMGLSGLRILASLVAFLASQLTEIKTYAIIKQTTGLRLLWLRNNGSALAAQLVDTLMIDLIALWWGLRMPFNEVAIIMMLSFTYKTCFSLICTPLYYFLVYGAKKLSTQEAVI
jgi:uncharacterized integral membrane protein (TIGR00697 family)